MTRFGAAPDQLDVDSLRHAFDSRRPFTVGVEEEILLVDPRTSMPVPVAAEVAARADDPRIKIELPASQVEIFTRPHADVAGVVDELAAGRSALVAACGDGVRPVAAAVHPLAGGPQAVAATERAQALVTRYGDVVRRQVVGALQVHVALGDADAALAVHNALRAHLPELAALAAAAPFHEGRDTGLASTRPLVAALLPRQGVPPVIPSWDAFVDDLAWGAASGHVPDPGHWWWELRPHPRLGTLEIRVPDVQPTVTATGSLVSVVHALVRHLAARHQVGEPLGVAPTWRIAENRWAALRGGVHGELADLVTGDRAPTAVRLHRLLDDIEAHAEGGLDEARALVSGNAADDLRAAGLAGAVLWLADVFLPDP